jgi:hypothetical protein
VLVFINTWCAGFGGMAGMQRSCRAGEHPGEKGDGLLFEKEDIISIEKWDSQELLRRNDINGDLTRSKQGDE